MPKSRRRFTKFGHDPKLKGNILVIAVVLMIFAVGLALMIRGCSSSGQPGAITGG